MNMKRIVVCPPKHEAELFGYAPSFYRVARDAQAQTGEQT
jgi:hypothetical protein